MRAGKRSSSAPKRPKPPPEPPRYLAHSGKDARGQYCFVGYQVGGSTQAGSGVTATAVVDIGRPFTLYVPSVPGKGKSGLVIDGMTGTNAEPWPPGMVLTGARRGWFGFRLIDPDGSGGTG